MKTWISNETHGKYLYIEAGEDSNAFEREMIRTAISESILPVTESFKDRTRCYECCISGLISLNEWMEKYEMNAARIKEVLFQINSVVVYLRGYLLSERNLLINGSCIFVDKKKDRLRFCIIPSGDNDFEAGLKDVIHEMLVHISIEDSEALRLGFRLMKLCEAKDFRLHDVLEIAGLREEAYGCGTENERENRSDDEINSRNQEYIRRNDMTVDPEILPDAEDQSSGSYESFTSRDIRQQDTGKGINREYQSADMGEGSRQQDNISEEAEGCGFQKKNHPAAGFILSQIILLGGAAAVYMLKGKAIAIRMLPVYLIMAICTAVYYIADHFLQKRRESKLRNGSSL